MLKWTKESNSGRPAWAWWSLTWMTNAKLIKMNKQQYAKMIVEVVHQLFSKTNSAGVSGTVCICGFSAKLVWMYKGGLVSHVLFVYWAATNQNLRLQPSCGRLFAFAMHRICSCQPESRQHLTGLTSCALWPRTSWRGPCHFQGTAPGSTVQFHQKYPTRQYERQRQVTTPNTFILNKS